MLVEWTKMKVKVVPIIGLNGKVAENIILLPGVNDVDDDKWNQARSCVDKDIRTNRIIEKHVTLQEKEVEVKNKETDEVKKEKKVVVKGKTLKQLSLDQASKIVENTFNLDTLNKWKEKESRDSIRALIMTQLEKVEKEGESAEKKKSRDRKNEDI
jgi:hypothetical protein